MCASLLGGRPEAFTAVLSLKPYLDPVKVLTGKIKDVAGLYKSYRSNPLDMPRLSVQEKTKHRSHELNYLFINAQGLYFSPYIVGLK